MLHFYQHAKNYWIYRHHFVVQALKTGLFCVGHGAAVDRHIGRPQLAINDAWVYASVESGQMQFLPYEEWHTPEGQTLEHPEGILERALVHISEAHK